MQTTLSVSIIAKNEEKNIQRCINSIKNIADEIILVDTGSTDNTVKLAEELGAKIYHFEWNYDFAACKNVALEKCTKDWVLVIDCDEELNKGQANKLKFLIQNSNREGYYVRLINYIGNININETSSLRLFRNRPEYRFESKLHEQIYYSIVNLKGENVLEVTDIILNHYGYDHNVFNMQDKIERNIKVLEGFDEKDKNGFYYYSLGNEYSKLGNIDKAKECFLLAIETKAPDYGYYPYLSVNLIKILLTTDGASEALKVTNRFIPLMSDFRDIYFLKAMCEYELKDYNESYFSLKKYCDLPHIPSKYPSFNFENDNNIEGLLNGLNSLRK